MTAAGRRTGQLVAARAQGSSSGKVHASTLLVPTGDPTRGLVPWWGLCGSGGAVTQEVTDPVDCRTCLALLQQRRLKIGDVADA